MADGALRSVFADFGFKFDEKALAKADALVDNLAKRAASIIAPLDAGGAAFGRMGAQAKAGASKTSTAFERVADMIRKAAAERQHAADVEFFATTAEGKAHAQWLQQRAARLAAIKTEAQAEEAAAQKRAAWEAQSAKFERDKAKKTAADRDAIDEAISKGSTRTTQGSVSFGGKFGTEQWKAAAKPVEGLIGVLTKLEKKTSEAIGRRLPAAFQRLAEKAGVAKGDFATMGEIAVGLKGTVVGVLGMAVHMAASFTSEFTQASEALRETARNARVTSSELQALQHAGAISGVGADRMTASVTALGSKLRDANSHLAGSSGVVHTLRQMGISARDASGQVRPTIDILDDVAVAMEHISSPRRRVRVAEALGLDRRMLDVLHTGAGGIRALREEMRELGGGVTPEATEAARKFAQAQARMQVGLTSVRSVIFTALAPAMEGLVSKGAKALGWLARMTRGSHMARNVLVALGVAGAAAAAPLIAAWLPAAAPFLLAGAAGLVLALALDDVQNFLEGNNSLTGEYVTKLRQLADGFIGVGNSARIIEWIKDEWNIFGDKVARVLDFIEHLPPAIRATLAPLRLLLGAFSAVTGHGDGPTEGGAGAPSGAPSPGTPAPGPAPGAPVQVGLDGQPIAVRGANGRYRSVPVPATRSVAAPGTAGGSTTVTTRVEGDRNVFHINGNDPAAMRRQVEQLLEQRERQRRERLSPRGDGE